MIVLGYSDHLSCTTMAATPDNMIQGVRIAQGTLPFLKLTSLLPSSSPVLTLSSKTMSRWVIQSQMVPQSPQLSSPRGHTNPCSQVHIITGAFSNSVPWIIMEPVRSSRRLESHYKDPEFDPVKEVRRLCEVRFETPLRTKPRRPCLGDRRFHMMDDIMEIVVVRLYEF